MPKLTDRCIADIRARVDIVDVVERIGGVVLKKAGSGIKGLCPFHDERSPSFTVRPGKGFVCFGCGKKGDLFGFVMEREGLPFDKAAEKIAAEFGVMLEHEGPGRRSGLRVERRAVAGAAVVPGAGDAATESDGSGGSGTVAGVLPARCESTFLGKAENVAHGSSAGVVPASENVLVLPEGVDPKSARRAVARQLRYEAGLRAEAAAHERWLKAHAPGVERRPLRAWSALVRARYEGGSGAVDGLLAVAAARAWPEHWMRWLIEAEMVSLPWLPWAEPAVGEVRREVGEGKRTIAFRVDAPVWGAAGDAMVLRDVRPVGYHQRFLAGDRKNWVFVPYFPDDENGDGGPKWLSTFQTGLRAECEGRGLAVRSARSGKLECEAVTPPLPFVLGARPGAALRFLVITEGQWDAVTFAGACGWLDGGEWPEGVVVMGARGSTGVDTLLAYWGAQAEAEGGAKKVSWMREHGPAVLVLADNDTAGKKWDEAPATKPGEVALPTFAGKIKFAGAGRVEVRRVTAALGKDFNDYWRARRPGVAAMHDWLGALGLWGAWGYGEKPRDVRAA